MPLLGAAIKRDIKMNKHAISQLTLTQLAELTPVDFEQIYDQGLDYRQELTNRVLSFLQTPEGWIANPEYASEFGGLYPVNIQYFPENDTDWQLTIHVCSSGEENSEWVVVLVMPVYDDEYEYVHTSVIFEPECINRILREQAAKWALNQWGQDKAEGDIS